MVKAQSTGQFYLMKYQAASCLTLAFACSLLLAGCSGAPAKTAHAKADPVPLQAAPVAEAVEAAPVAEYNGDKIARLEQQVAALQNEIIAARPKIAKIDVMEQKFKDLSLGLDRIDAAYGVGAAAPHPVEKAAPEPQVKKPEAAPAPVKKAVQEEAPVKALSGKAVVEDLRIGEQKGYSRMVLDLGKPAKVNYDIDNTEKILLIEIPGFAWQGPKEKTVSNSPLISSYKAESDSKGSRLVVQLKKPAKIGHYSAIGPTGGKPARSVLDIAAQ